MIQYTSLKDTAILFPGQGTQFVGMGSSTVARHLLAQADEQLEKPLSSLCQLGPAECLNATENAQLAVYVTSYAIYQALFGTNAQPFCFAGHSLGECTALVASGALSFQKGLDLVNCRAQAMSQCQGGMIAVVGLGVPKMQALLAALSIGDLWIANINTDKQIVLSGSSRALEQIEKALKNVHEAHLVKRLDVQIPSHSPLMKPAAVELGKALEESPIVCPHVPILCSTTITLCQEPDALRNNLYKQLTSPLDWAGCINMLARQGIKRLIEIGPRPVLKSMVKHLVDVECISYTEADIE